MGRVVLTGKPARLVATERESAPIVAPVAAYCQVMLDDIPVHADIGVLSAEIGVQQPLFVHVTLDVTPPEADELDQTFDYRGIHAATQALGQERIALIETFARRLAEHCLADRRVMVAEVRVDKPRAIPGSMARTRIRLTRSA